MRLLLLFLAAVPLTALAQEPCATPNQWTPCDFTFELNAAEASRFPDLASAASTLQLHGEFRSPRLRTLLIPAFWDGGRKFVIRVSPTEAGEWTFRLTSNIERWQGKQGTFNVTPGLAPSFIRNVNVHHWQTVDTLQPHLWMGDTLYRAGFIPKDEFEKTVTARSAQMFNHLRVLLMGEEKDQAQAWSDGRPNPVYFQDLDRRLLFASQKGMIIELVIADHPEALTKLFPTWQKREEFMKYVVNRYAGYNITWQVVRAFEGYKDGRPITKEIGLLLNKLDPYAHPKTPGAGLTSTPLLGDQWMNFITSQNASDALGSVEHQLYQLPFVNTVGGKTDDEQRKALWNSSMNGAYPVREGGPESSAAAWKIWYDFFAGTRYWELEPYFYVDGGRAVALVRDFGDYVDAVEYVVYIEKPGALEVTVQKHGYDARWFNPRTGESVKIKDFKSERFIGEPPTMTEDWVLHISREGKKEGMLKSYKFESRLVPVQEVESQPRMVPFTIVTPSENDLSLSKDIPYSVKIKRDTRGTRSMLYVWTVEVVAEGQGFRVVGTGTEGTFRIPKDIIRNFPGVLSLRVSAINANGKIYSLDKIHKLVP
jgi:hypothetical protein